MANNSILKTNPTPLYRTPQTQNERRDLLDEIYNRKLIVEGHTVAAVMDDGEFLCLKCVRRHRETILSSIADNAADGWNLSGVTHSGLSPSTAQCAHCSAIIWSRNTRDN